MEAQRRLPGFVSTWYSLGPEGIVPACEPQIHMAEHADAACVRRGMNGASLIVWPCLSPVPESSLILPAWKVNHANKLGRHDYQTISATQFKTMSIRVGGMQLDLNMKYVSIMLLIVSLTGFGGIFLLAKKNPYKLRERMCVACMGVKPPCLDGHCFKFYFKWNNYITVWPLIKALRPNTAPPVLDAG